MCYIHYNVRITDRQLAAQIYTKHVVTHLCTISLCECHKLLISVIEYKASPIIHVDVGSSSRIVIVYITGNASFIELGLRLPASFTIACAYRYSKTIDIVTYDDFIVCDYLIS